MGERFAKRGRERWDSPGRWPAGMAVAVCRWQERCWTAAASSSGGGGEGHAVRARGCRGTCKETCRKTCRGSRRYRRKMYGKREHHTSEAGATLSELMCSWGLSSCVLEVRWVK